MVIPMMKQMRNSVKLRNLVPVFLILAVLNLLALLVILGVYFYIIRFLLVEMERSLTFQCLQCLFQALIIMLALGLSILKGRSRFFQNVLITAPLAVLAVNAFFSDLDVIGRAVGSLWTMLLYFFVYIRLFSARGESLSYLGLFVSYLVGLNAAALLFSGRIFILSVFSTTSGIIPLGGVASAVSEPVGGLASVLRGFTDSLAFQIVGLGATAIICILLGRRLFAEVLGWRRLSKAVSLVRQLPREPTATLVREFVGILGQVHFAWGQKVLLRTLQERLQDDRTGRLITLKLVEGAVVEVRLRDAICQVVEDEERVYRRAIGWEDSLPPVVAPVNGLGERLQYA